MSNILLSKDKFQNELSQEKVMTMFGTVVKSAFLLCILAISFIASYAHCMSYYPAGQVFANPDIKVDLPPEILLCVFGSSIVGFILAMLINSFTYTAPYLAPIYTILEGIVLGSLSAAIEADYPGIVMQAVMGTFGSFAVMLFFYMTRLIVPTEKFYIGLLSCMSGILILYFSNLFLAFCGITMPIVNGHSTMAIAIQSFIVLVAVFNLIADFDIIESGVNYGAPKHMEWYGAFGLIVTICWLYLEMLRWFSKIRGSDD